jgi:hypothetical protein
MSANSVDSDQYVDGSIDTAHYADNSITGDKLADNIDIAGTLDVTGILTADSNVVIAGDLTVNGTTTTLNTATLDVEDKNITINYGAGDTSASANGAGITIQDAVDASNDATILWDTTNDEFDFSHAINVTGNIAVSGTVDGRDVATDGTKLDGIESSATADQTAAEIRTAVEAATDSNVFTDADHTKLNAIEALADVTDATNVTAAGALMDSELTAIASVKALNQGVATTDSPTFVNVTGTLATAAQPNITSVGTLTGFTSTGIDDNADATVITIDSSENVGIGTASPVTFGENTRGITLNGTAAGQHLSFQQSDSYKGSLYNNDNTIILTSEIGEIQINAVSGVVFNQSGGDVDFRVESDGNAYMLFVDGGANHVNIGTETDLGGTLNVLGNTAIAGSSGGAYVATGATLSIQGTGAYNSNYFGSSLATVAIRSNEPTNDGWNPTLHIALIRQSLVANKDSTGGIGFTTIDDSNANGVDDAARIIVYNEASSSSHSATALRFFNNVGGSKTQVAQTALDLYSTGAVFNADGRDMDFRVESDINTHAFFLNGGDGLISFGNATTSLTTGTSFVAGDNYALYSGVDATTAKNHCVFGNANGYIGSISTNGSTTTYATSSDERLKENIADADDAGSKIDAIQVRKFDWKVDGSHQDYGMVAQELQTVAPEAVHQPANEEDMMGVDYSKLVPMMLKEIQTLRLRITALENA